MQISVTLRAPLLRATTLVILSSSVFAATIRVPTDQPTIKTAIGVAFDGDTLVVTSGANNCDTVVIDTVEAASRQNIRISSSIGFGEYYYGCNYGANYSFKINYTWDSRLITLDSVTSPLVHFDSTAIVSRNDSGVTVYGANLWLLELWVSAQPDIPAGFVEISADGEITYKTWDCIGGCMLDCCPCPVICMWIFTVVEPTVIAGGVMLPDVNASGISLDIKPGSCENPLNTKDKDPQGKAIIPAAIIGADGFDVRDIDPTSIRLEGVTPLRHNFADVSTPSVTAVECACVEDGSDGIEDMTLKFSRAELIDALGDISGVSNLTLTLAGSLIDGTEFTATDCVRFTPKEGSSTNPLHPDGDPVAFTLVGNYPNPFNPATSIIYGVPERSEVSIEIYNILGQLVNTLYRGYRDAGYYTVTWDASAVSSGVYFYQMNTESVSVSKKMLLLK